MQTRITWIVVGAIVVVAVFAGLDALRSSGGKPPTASAERDQAVTVQTETGAELESSARLRSGKLVRLTPGRVTTDERRWYFVTFTVPPGWYGHERAATTASFAIGKELSEEAADLSSGGISVRSGGISVHVLDISVARAARRLEKEPGLRIFDVSRFGLAAMRVEGTAWRC